MLTVRVRSPILVSNKQNNVKDSKLHTHAIEAMLDDRSYKHPSLIGEEENGSEHQASLLGVWGDATNAL